MLHDSETGRTAEIPAGQPPHTPTPTRLLLHTLHCGDLGAFALAWLFVLFQLCHRCRLLKDWKSGGMSGWKGNQVKGTKEVTGHSLSHCRRPSLFWSRPAGRSTPSSDPPGSAGSASASRGRQRAQTGERSEIPELFQQLNSIYFVK